MLELMSMNTFDVDCRRNSRGSDAVVNHSEMSADMQQFALDTTYDAMYQFDDEVEIASHIKEVSFWFLFQINQICVF